MTCEARRAGERPTASEWRGNIETTQRARRGEAGTAAEVDHKLPWASIMEAESLAYAALSPTDSTTDVGTPRPLDPGEALDALEDLALAVIIAAAAIEAHANDMIGRLRDDAMVEIPTRLGGETVAVMRNKTAMDWLPISDKLARAAPLLHGGESIKGTVAWQKYKRLFRIRNALVHPRREAVNDPLKPSAFGRLLLGEGSSAPEDAASVIEALEPGWLPNRIRPELGL